MSQKHYWKNLAELNSPISSKEGDANEFKEELPFDLSEGILGATTPRRDFLKFLGFSTLAATLVSSCEMPVRRAIPYAIKPEDIVPGVPNYYASTFTDGGEYCPIVIKTRDGRPIKVEGNRMSSITKGGTSARVQASVLNLYDTARLRFPMADGQEATYEAIDRMVIEALTSSKATYLLTGSINSPTTLEVIKAFTAKYPNVKHVMHDAVSYSAMLQANEACYGKRTLPTYHFDKAKTIVSLGADFLGTWIAPIEFAKSYSVGRKMNAKNLTLSRHYHVEGTHTITGANADYRVTCKPSEMGTVAVALYNAVTGGTPINLANPALNQLVTNAAADLNNGNGLVVCGSNDINIQTIVNAINDHIKANGVTINWTSTSNSWQGIDSDMVALVQAMNGGQVGALLMHGVNPIYDYYDGQAFATGLAKVPCTVSFGDRLDETAQKCKYLVPDNHYLESWGDAEPKPNYFSLKQPGIAPLFKTRAIEDSLLIWSGSKVGYLDFWKQYWLTKIGDQKKFDQALQDGVIEPIGNMPIGGASFAGKTAEAVSNIKAGSAAGTIELVVYPSVSLGAGGNWSNNPWLQEMPDPITRATWDNYVCVSPARAVQLNAELSGHNEVDRKKKVLTIKSSGYSIDLPLVVVPGMHNDVVAISMGYGRDKQVGMAASGTGKNAFPFLTYNGATFDSNNIVSLTDTNTFYEVAITQPHMSYEGRPIIHEYTLKEFGEDPLILLKERAEEIQDYSDLPWVMDGIEQKENIDSHDLGGKEKTGELNRLTQTATNIRPVDDKMEEDYRENGTMYPNYIDPGIKWGMQIDLNSCIGCGACVVGCMAENNVSVVGKHHVLLYHEMHWLRIDRYFTGDPDKPDSIQTLFQPMLCQHCDNAPCENVCPVSATNHSSEGLNQMIYNRCIGTKYCANNCPYKVRRFNWMDWNGADCFADNIYEDYKRDEMNDQLTRMVLNPDVTVRSRGVMEKCSFCVQRLQDAKLVAKKAERPLQDGEARTACQQACPTEAIVFGNVNDKTSEIYTMRHQNQRERTFYVLEQLHTLPNVSYLAKIRNTDIVEGGNPATDIMMDQSI